MASTPSVYLAGPEVFFPEAVRAHIDRRRKVLLMEAGLEGLSPSDNAIDIAHEADPARAIYDANLALMAQADGLIANLTPFRGPSADAGTVYELGYMLGQGKPAVGFTVCQTPYNARVEGEDIDPNGAAIEPFGLADNLMLDCGLARAGGVMLQGERAYPPTGFAPADYFDEALFRQAVACLKRLMSALAGQ
ncbi:nucleoside 2-deoxyribosyltransferase [Marinobacter halodurans]|uniref:Nucleoside 2-deoxyribosyltransferase n=1 Tax=Marinobacter halodurans TaxID=2528979 RepID=A0ABY1ZHJ9_9GAMM|nr:nucleoside 2-deoxyribosyltransferase [Marinobacter halodurans]TBW49220.1 nucleoside 2-deoxyribosyltransferase [Marinobacter halodurans]